MIATYIATSNCNCVSELEDLDTFDQKFLIVADLGVCTELLRRGIPAMSTVPARSSTMHDRRVLRGAQEFVRPWRWRRFFLNNQVTELRLHSITADTITSAIGAILAGTRVRRAGNS